MGREGGVRLADMEADGAASSSAAPPPPTAGAGSGAVPAGVQLEVDAADVLRLIMQFCREAGLSRSVKCIQEESGGVPFNCVDDGDALLADVLMGRWEVLLPKLSVLTLPPALLSDIYEQVG
ncbi:hypothetical protein EON67_02185 [archaeon]|nr:MAG: hypothetical protein EON67_02185 [archaeon]